MAVQEGGVVVRRIPAGSLEGAMIRTDRNLTPGDGDLVMAKVEGEYVFRIWPLTEEGAQLVGKVVEVKRPEHDMEIRTFV